MIKKRFLLILLIVCAISRTNKSNTGYEYITRRDEKTGEVSAGYLGVFSENPVVKKLYIKLGGRHDLYVYQHIHGLDPGAAEPYIGNRKERFKWRLANNYGKLADVWKSYRARSLEK